MCVSGVCVSVPRVLHTLEGRDCTLPHELVSSEPIDARGRVIAVAAAAPPYPTVPLCPGPVALVGAQERVAVLDLADPPRASTPRVIAATKPRSRPLFVYMCVLCVCVLCVFTCVRVGIWCARQTKVGEEGR